MILTNEQAETLKKLEIAEANGTIGDEGEIDLDNLRGIANAKEYSDAELEARSKALSAAAKTDLDKMIFG